MKYFDLTNEELIVAYKAAMGASMAPLKVAAEIWCEMEQRGIDLVPMANPLTQFFRQIAAGKLLPETVLKFGGAVRLLDLISTLVIEDQAKITEPGARVEVLTATGVQYCLPEKMHVYALKQVFSDGRIRRASEQKLAMVRLRVTRASEPAKVAPLSDVRVSLTPDTAMAGAFAAAGHGTADERLLRFAIEAWGKWPQTVLKGARRDYMTEKLGAELAWSLMKQWDPKALVAAIGKLLDHAEAAIVSAKRIKPSNEYRYRVNV